MPKSRICGWGNYPVLSADIVPLYSDEIKFKKGSSVIPRGLGRSYGDSALNDVVIDTTPSDRFLAFDEVNGLLFCQAGVSLAEILEIIVPKGWFLPVTPGTKYVTVGGAVAADIHGKNHHVEGSFCDFVTRLKIITGDGNILDCSKEVNSELYHATCGGMGLTGIILEVDFTLKPIKGAGINVKTVKTKNLEETLEIFAENKSITYSVAWIDCLTKGRNMGRSLVMLGEHHDDQFEGTNPKKKINTPFFSPSFFLNRFSIKIFNTFYYHHQLKGISENVIHYDPYFYPLDRLNNWNRFYGKKGFLQYQFVLPFSAGYEGLKKVMDKITNWGQGSFLAVLKTFGNENKNLLSFPKAGYTLALDIKYNEGAFDFFNYLDKLILEMGGRLYLAKDARMSEGTFKASYTNWESFQQIREKYGAINVFCSAQSRRIGLN